MTTFNRSDDLKDAEFADTSLRGARFVGVDVSEVVMRGVEIQGAEIDSPWLAENDNVLLVNGVDVIPYVEAELDRRFPGRELRRTTTPEGLQEAWAVLELTWAAMLARVDAMPTGTIDMSVAGEWSFAETLRHLVMATDVWLRKAIQGVEQPYDPIGLVFAGAEDEGFDLSIFRTDKPSFAEVLEVRAGRVAMVREFLAAVTPEQLLDTRQNPWAPNHAETVLSCLQTILEEEWEHHRYATRDLDSLEASSTS